MVLDVNESIQIPDEEFEWSFVRASGPGGQNVNKVSSKAVMRWHVAESPSVPEHVKDRFLRLNKKRVTVGGELVMSSQRWRDQEKNKLDCLEKLAELLRQAATLPKKRKATKPSAGSKRRRLENKRRRANVKSLRQSPPTD